MSRRIFRDVEEALQREVRRITFHNDRTLDTTVLQDLFDPFTGEIVQRPIEASFYDSSADTNHIQYPHIFVRLLKTREDRFTDRVIPEYGQNIEEPVLTSPKAFEIVVNGADGSIAVPGNELQTTLFNIRKVQVGQLLRIYNNNNIGTYTISSITVNSSGPHSIFVSSTLLNTLPALFFDAVTRTVVFNDGVDVSTVKAGDNFIDFSSVSFPIVSADPNTGKLILGGSGSPDLTAGSQVTRTGNVFQLADSTLDKFRVLDPTKPVMAVGISGNTKQTASQGRSPSVPIDAYYLVRIDSKERATHVDILNRVWEEFNPPRTGLPTIIRSSLSAEQLLTQDVLTGGSSTINVADNSEFNIGDSVFIFDDLMPSKSDYGFQRPFEAKVKDKVSTDQLILTSVVPDTFLASNNAKVVSNCTFYLHMFHFVDHATKDVEGAQYFIHEFTFWVQVFIDRLETPVDFDGVIQEIQTPIENLQGDIILDDN